MNNTGTVSIKDLDKAAVLAALYNRATTGGMGFMQYTPEPMTVEQAREILRSFERVTKKIFFFFEIEKRPASNIYFDYIGGRSMKVNLTADEEFDAQRYDEYNGSEAASNAIDALRQNGDVNPATTQAAHHASTIAAAEETKSHFGEKSGPGPEIDVPGFGPSKTFHVGLDDVADVLGPKIDEAKRRLRGEK